MAEDGNGRVPWYFCNPVDGSELVLIPGGWFWMGSGVEDSEASGYENPRHLHFVEPYYLALACVTVAQFRAFVKATGDNADNNWKKDKDPAEHPVRYVNCDDAQAYCRWAELRLPGDAEWELAARGYGALKYPWGENWEGGRRVCWDKQKGPNGATEPALAHPEGVSRFGASQQSGNLWEWCEDDWDNDAYQRYARGDFDAPKQSGSRVVRGGSWSSSNPKYFRAAFRNNNTPGNRNNNQGFRVARTLTTKQYAPGVQTVQNTVGSVLVTVQVMIPACKGRKRRVAALW